MGQFDAFEKIILQVKMKIHRLATGMADAKGVVTRTKTFDQKITLGIGDDGGWCAHQAHSGFLQYFSGIRVLHLPLDLEDALGLRSQGPGKEDEDV